MLLLPYLCPSSTFISTFMSESILSSTTSNDRLGASRVSMSGSMSGSGGGGDGETLQLMDGAYRKFGYRGRSGYPWYRKKSGVLSGELFFNPEANAWQYVLRRVTFSARREDFVTEEHLLAQSVSTGQIV